MDSRFAHVADWIFDLDNCLYPASTRLFDLIDERMGSYIQRLLNLAARSNTFRRFQPQAAAHQRLRQFHEQVVELVLVFAPQFQRVAECYARDSRRSSSVPRNAP